jgi:hypothetical protein
MNKIITFRTQAVDLVAVIQQLFPVAIKLFNKTDNP